jgi:glycosyltransferase involved in cell wall biosynthesis
MKVQQVTLTVITPFFNSFKFLKNHLERSKALVKDLPIEFIYIDDGSVDKSYYYLKKKIRGFNRIRVYKLKKNFGPGSARNLGIKKSKSSNIIFLDCDDYLIKKGLNELLKYLSVKRSFDLIFFNFIKKNFLNYNLAKKYLSKISLIKNFLRLELDMCPNFYLYNKNFLIKNSIYFHKGIYEDINFVLKCFVKQKKIIRLHYTVYKKNITKNSITNSYTDRHLVDFIKSSIRKVKYFNTNIKNKIKIVKTKDLQYGLRGDYFFANKILNNIIKSKYDLNYININFKKIINSQFKSITKYDEFTKKNLF